MSTFLKRYISKNNKNTSKSNMYNPIRQQSRSPSPEPSPLLYPKLPPDILKKNSSIKIGIFGDSFADPYNNLKREWGISWTQLLTENYGYIIENFAEGGSSLWWSYERFLKNYEKYDQIIFVVTMWGRLSSSEKINNGCYVHFPARGITDSDFIENSNEFTVKICHSIKDYFLYFQNDQQEKFLHNRIIEEIINKCNSDKKSLLLIPAFDNPINFQTIFKIPLCEIVRKEQIINNVMDITKITYVPVYEKNRANHMSKQNNEILAQLVYEIIEGTRTSVTIDDFVFEKFPNPEDYWGI